MMEYQQSANGQQRRHAVIGKAAFSATPPRPLVETRTTARTLIFFRQYIEPGLRKCFQRETDCYKLFPDQVLASSPAAGRTPTGAAGQPECPAALFITHAKPGSA
jgi:hypothetical protein